MRRIDKFEYEICKKHGLLFDGKNLYEGLDKSVANRASYKNNVFGRNYIKTRHHVYITTGRNGISDSLDYFTKKEVEHSEY
jgi:hypothetical protein